MKKNKIREKTRDTFRVWGIAPDAGFPPFSAVSSVQRRKVLRSDLPANTVSLFCTCYKANNMHGLVSDISFGPY